MDTPTTIRTVSPSAEHTLLERLHHDGFSLSFSGQGFSWLDTLREALHAGASRDRITGLVRGSDSRLAALETELAGLAPAGFHPLRWVDGEEHTRPQPAYSVPGILLAQIAVLQALQAQGLSVHDARACYAHSQGVLAREYVAAPERATELVAIARLIGAAVTQEAQLTGLGAVGEQTPMLAVRGLHTAELSEMIGGTDCVIGLRHTTRAHTLVGPSASIELLRQRISEREGVVAHPLEVTAGFHHPGLSAAVDRCVEWARRVGLDGVLARRCAEAVMVTPVDWPSQLSDLDAEESPWLLECGPGEGVASMTEQVLRGRGCAVIRAATAAGQEQIFDPHVTVELPPRYARFAPRVEPGTGRVHTAFSRLTGRSPIVLAGMTPTTVTPEIVAAAANAGFWAELAGGGQVTPEILDRNLSRLGELLEPGVQAQFNAMYLDPYLWGLHVGGKKLVRKARAAGAPIDGLVITAGVPERDEAVELIQQLRAENIPWVAFKPGAVTQIRQVLAIAREIPEIPVVMQIEGGAAGGHHSWENLDELLLDSYDACRRLPNVVVLVGGGIGTPERAADYITGRWALAYGNTPMPLDGVLVGTAAMAAREAHTSPQVKQLLVDTSGEGAVVSGRSQLGADIHEINNSFARAGALLDEVAGDAEAVAARREEIIAAINATCKKFFGELDQMTYRQWLERYVELSGPDSQGWIDDSWRQRFAEMLSRAEARLCPQDRGEVVSLLAECTPTTDPGELIAQLAEHYPVDTLVHPSDRAWFVQLLRRPGKPANFVPVIDAEVRRWWRSDSLWQAHDSRYSADEVCVIPGPVAVEGITEVDEPIADLLARFEAGVATAVQEEADSEAHAEPDSPLDALLRCPTTVWAGRSRGSLIHALAPADQWEKVNATTAREPVSGARVEVLDDARAVLRVNVGTELEIALTLATRRGAAPVVSPEAAEKAMDRLTRIAAGGKTETSFVLSEDHAARYHTLTSAGLSGVSVAGLPAVALDVLVGACWPAIFGVLRTATVPGASQRRVVEGMLSLVHLEHHVRLCDPGSRVTDLLGRSLNAHARVDDVTDTDIGRVVVVRVAVKDETGQTVATLSERFAIRGRAGQATARTNTSALPSVHSTSASARVRASVCAPDSMRPFALVSGDHNPIHVSAAAARLAGLDDVIVHGMWTSAVAELVTAAGYEDEDVSTPAARIVEFTATMIRPIYRGERVEFTVERTGVDDRPGCGEVRELQARVNGETVLTAVAVMAEPETVYVFPGQGIQHQGMGQQAYKDSTAARAVWDRADAHTRSSLGFSVLEIVRNNPRSIEVRGQRFFHPDGVLFLTQFTQVAMATLGVAQVAQMREAHLVADGACFAGHSVGEYNALAAYSGALSLEAVLDIVFARGLTMHRLVERDEHGQSNYGLAALRPHAFGLPADQVSAFVNELSRESGEFLEIANYNLKGKQYAVAGTRRGLELLAARAEEARPGARGLVMIPGIDVPFHSSILRDGVADFREHLDSLLPEDIPYQRLVGRYIPNLVARPFELSEEFLASMREVVDSPILDEVAGAWAQYIETPARLARILLIELLAWQFASPVRWIETQDLLIEELGITRVVEVGVGSAPTLARIMEQTIAAHPDHPRVEVLNVERDRAAVFAEDSTEFASAETDASADTGEPDTTEKHQSATSAASAENSGTDAPPAVQPTPAASSKEAHPAEDLPFTSEDATLVLLSMWTHRPIAEIAPTDSIETLTDGVSSRRNQILLDLGVEFGLGAIDGAADADIPELQATVARLARGYQPFGPVLGDAVTAALRTITGPAGAKPSAVAERVASVWQLGEGWQRHVEAELAVTETQQPAGSEELNACIDAAVQQVSQRARVSVEMPRAQAGGGQTIDAAVLGEFAEQLTGRTGVLAETARTILRHLGHEQVPTADEPSGHAGDDLHALIESELGAEWPRLVERCFDPRRAVRIDDRWASAREDISRAGLGLIDASSISVTGAGAEAAAQARHYGLDALAEQALDTSPGEFAEDVAVVTGASPGSIAAAVVERLVAGGATVVATTSRLTHERLRFYTDLYARHARGGAQLWVVPANLGSYADVDALSRWIGEQQTRTVGAETVVEKPALVPTVLFPFAAPRVVGTGEDAGPQAENQMRVLLWSVERLVAALSALGRDTHVGQRLHVVLPGSPNRGLFGGDGAYGESKAALDALVNRWSAESGLRMHTSLVHALIGWVRGTGLMGGNDELVSQVEEKGIRTYSTEEMADELVALLAPEVRVDAAKDPITRDLTGGLATIPLALSELVRSEAPGVTPVSTETHLHALPNPPRHPALSEAARAEFAGKVSTPLDEMVVMISAAELGPYGSARTRYEVETTGDLSAAGVVELAWSMGLISFDNGAWVTADGEDIAEEEIADRFHDEVLARVGVRRFHDDVGMVDNLAPELASVYLDRPLSFAVASREEAMSYRDEGGAEIHWDEERKEWMVTCPVGAEIRVPRRTVMSRFVGGQIPTGFDPTRWGIPAEMVSSLDRVAVWNLVCTVDAFLSAGFSPAELMAHVHPALVSSTQGTGMGGMTSMRSLYIDAMLAEARAHDILQEALPNVVAAHVMQSYIGGYGQMIHPVAACATAAVSVEEGVDKIRLGKADCVIAGGIDDLSVEGITGFGDMGATADSQEMRDKGIDDRFFSRANDRRRGGFVESAGGGTILLMRGSTAFELGLPVQAVVAYAQSFADGIHTSIPAPGLGAVAAARGGTRSALARSLAAHGVEPGEVRVVSKHDTSTAANDPNESELHERIAAAIGRQPGTPLFVISQKTLTGHAKGGAAAFQITGLAQVMRSGVIPPNRSLDCVDPVLRRHPNLVWLREALELPEKETIKAGLVTSLGFGHVSALIALVHPAAFYAAVEHCHGEQAAQRWAQRALHREIRGAQRIVEGIYGGRPLYSRPADRRLPGDKRRATESEVAMLLDPEARLQGERYGTAG